MTKHPHLLFIVLVIFVVIWGEISGGYNFSVSGEEKCEFKFCLFGAGSVLAADKGEQTVDRKVYTDTSQREQEIVGWGTAYGGDHTNPEWRKAYRDLGLNLLRVPMEKEVLVDSKLDWATPVELTDDLDHNLDLMNIDAPSNMSPERLTTGFEVMDPRGDTAEWLAENALEPGRVKIAGSVWTPPHWMKGPTGETQNFVGKTDDYETPFFSDMKVDWVDEPRPTGDTVGGRLKTEDDHIRKQYGLYIASWVTGWNERYDVKMDVISLQNEAGFENPFDSMTFIVNKDGEQDFSQYAQGLKAVKDIWEKYDLDTRIKGPHHAGFPDNPENPHRLWEQNEMIAGVKEHEDPELIDFLDYYNANFYNSTDEGNTMNIAGFWEGGEQIEEADWSWHTPPGVKDDGKPIWYSETGDADSGGWPNSIETALKIHSALVHGQGSSYIYWKFSEDIDELNQHILLTENQLSKPLESKKYAAFKQYSRFVRPGAVRIKVGFGPELESSVGGNSIYDIENSLNISGFLHEEDNELTYVLVNMKNYAQNVELNLDNVPERFLNEQFNIIRTTDEESFAQVGQLVPETETFLFEVPAESVVTLSTINW